MLFVFGFGVGFADIFGPAFTFALADLAFVCVIMNIFINCAVLLALELESPLFESVLIYRFRCPWNNERTQVVFACPLCCMRLVQLLRLVPLLPCSCSVRSCFSRCVFRVHVALLRHPRKYISYVIGSRRKSWALSHGAALPPQIKHRGRGHRVEEIP